MTLPLATQYGITQTAMDFVSRLSELGDIKAAANRSGVSETHAYNLIRLPQVQAALAAEVRRKLALGAALGVKVLLELAAGAQSERVRADCAKALVDRAGFVAPRAAAAGTGIEKTLNEMSIGELKDLAAKLEDEIAGRARPLNAPASPDTPSQVSELLD